jgi:hypothetical protein
MSDKSSRDQTGSIPKQPPKRPSRDYSALPQRPITLKQAGKKKSAGKGSKVSANARISNPQIKKTTTKRAAPRAKRRTSDEWLLKGIAQSTRAYAQQQAEAHGLALEDWLEQLIQNHQQTVGEEQVGETDDDYLKYDLEQIVDSLNAIEARLERIEDQRGFWSRLWEQAMKQSKS